MSSSDTWLSSPLRVSRGNTTCVRHIHPLSHSQAHIHTVSLQSGRGANSLLHFMRIYLEQSTKIDHTHTIHDQPHTHTHTHTHIHIHILP